MEEKSEEKMVGRVAMLGCGLVNLDLSRANLFSFYGLSELKVLTHLDVSNNRLKTLVGCPPSVTHLRVSNNPLQTLHGAPSKLESLGCSYTHLIDFDGIQSAQDSLKTLVCAFSLIRSFNGLTNFLAPKVRP